VARDFSCHSFRIGPFPAFPPSIISFVLAMVLERPGAGVVEPEARNIPVPAKGQVLLKVLACGVCRTDLHLVSGDLPQARLPIVPGHEIVGVVERGGEGAGLTSGTRVGVGWLGHTCTVCSYCASGRENLCPRARFTGCQLDGGYAEYCLVDARYAFEIPAAYGDVEAAPLLCAGLIGYRSYRMAGDARRLGLYGFGAAAHIIVQIAVRAGRSVYAFTSPSDARAQAFARERGATWAGGSDEAPPEPLDAAIIYAPVGPLVPRALEHVVPGGTVVCAGIHMSDIPSFPYELLWQERVVRSVANLTRQDALDFLRLAAQAPIATRTHAYPLRDANRALADLRDGRLEGAAVLVP
jgi:propanol-preferring alcohol dehydrogenase